MFELANLVQPLLLSFLYKEVQKNFQFDHDTIPHYNFDVCSFDQILGSDSG